MKPIRLSTALLFTTALALPGTALAQEGPVLPPQPTDQIEAPADDLSPEDDSLEPFPEDTAEPDVSLGGEILVTGRRNRDETRSSEQVVNVLSTEDIARTGEGDIAGALSRVTGLSVVGNGFVYVRGLGDRYSLALLNGLPLPSPEPLKRVVPLDIFPTNVVASSLVQKSYSANYPGEFGGGVINLTTIAIPDETFLSVGASASADTETTGHFGYSYYGSGTDWTGFDNGDRDVPPMLNAYLQGDDLLADFSGSKAVIIDELVDTNFVLLQKLGNVPANFSGSVTGGTAFDMGDARVGLIATASYGNQWRTRDIIQQTPLNADLSTLQSDRRSVVTDNNITVNGMVGLGVEIGEHRFRFTNLFIRDTLKQSRLGEGEQDNGYSIRLQDTGWYERQLFDSQFVGELHFGDFGIDLRGGYANSQRNVPFESSFMYIRSNVETDPYGDIFLNYLDNGSRGYAQVSFSNLDEDLWYGGVDFSYLVTPRFGASVGYAYTDTYRINSRRAFSITANPSTPTYIFSLRPDNLISEPFITDYNYRVIELTEADPAFAASLRIHAGYAKINWEPIDYVTIDAGVRYESAKQHVRSYEVFAEPTVAPVSNLIENDYFLPGVTITWEASPDLQLRLNGSKTIARPQFREQLPILYYDPDTNRSYRGEPLLLDSTLLNGEARIEYYMGGSDRISVAGFYKEIKNPIETSFSFGANDTIGNFANAPKAELYGAEVDAVKYFDVFETRRLFVIANYTYTQSQLKIGPDDIVYRYGRAPTLASNIFIDGSPLTGQSDHIANLQVGFESTSKLSQQTILVKYASERVVGRGDGAFPDILEDPGIQIDFVWREGIKLLGVDTEWKFEVRNILGENFEEFQATDDARIEISTYDRGTIFSLGVSANF